MWHSMHYDAFVFIYLLLLLCSFIFDAWLIFFVQAFVCLCIFQNGWIGLEYGRQKVPTMLHFSFC
jgi:hypothetical protein